jgi:ATP-dependent 26S proteasome regulatory subunit
VFLEKRSLNEIQRNKLVSVFLRLLEYYQAVLFLTTNRINAFDPAFESRIHLTIHYPNLDFPSRLQVWQIFLRLDGQQDDTGLAASGSRYMSAIQDADLEKLAQVDLNGREIKNVVKTARLLAANDKKPLSMDHVETVLRVRKGEELGEAESAKWRQWTGPMHNHKRQAPLFSAKQAKKKKTT